MRLTQLEIFGFKSFAQKVHIPFGPGITAIVGPNGCGKSNIVEAIRWVLGEQRAGAFRSHRMEEVIFAGARQRKQLGMAEVALTIENSNHVLPIEFNEVTMTRRLFRSGESDYLLNKIPCRLLDIHNLLMDTGLGQGAYAVMEQGMVDEIISEKTENRRRILEEAAGITKYKMQRRSTWSRLESANADLIRIEDIITEVKRQVDYLSRQVGRARRYQRLKEELDEQELLLGRYRFFATKDELRPLQDELGQLNRTAEEGSTGFTTREAALEKLRLDQTEAETAMQDVGRELSRSTQEIHDRERQLAVVREQLNAAVQRIERSGSEREDYARQLEESAQQQQDTARASEAVLRELETTQERLKTHEERSVAAERSYEAHRAELDKRQRQQMNLLREQGELSRAVERLKTELDGLSRYSAQLQAEISRVTDERDKTREAAQQAGEEARHIGEDLQQLQQQQRAGQDREQALAALLVQLGEQRSDLRRTIEADQARLHVMEKVRSGYEGYSSGVRTLMLDSPYADLFQGVLGDLIEVEPRYHQAVEAALGDSLEALVATTRAGILDAIQHLKNGSGRAGIFPLEWQHTPAPTPAALPAVPGLIGPLVDHVRADASIAPLISRLLHNTFLVEDLALAVELTERHLDQQIRLVTPAGDAIDVHGRIAGGKPEHEDASLLGRRQEIRALKTGIAHEKAQLAGVGNSFGSATQHSAVLSRRLQRLNRDVETRKEQEREQAHLQQSNQSEARRLQDRLDQLGREQGELKVRRQSLEASIHSQGDKLGAVERQGKDLETSIREYEERRQQSDALRRKELDQLAVLRTEQARLVEQSQSLKRDTERLQHMKQNLGHNLERLEKEVEKSIEERRNLTAQEEHITAELGDMHKAQDTLEKEGDRKRQHWDEVNTHRRELEEEISRLQRELNAQRERRLEVEIRINELNSHAEHIQERLQEEQHCDVAAMGAPASEDLDPDWSAQRVDELHQSIQRLGSVHVGVLEEYEEQKERFDFLCHQRDDLLGAAEDLKKSLSLIDRTARRVFRQTFEEIRQKFKETFVSFFPGGEADLQLEPDVDALEANIDIIARPSGKRLQGITLLSGGEKALTAIALLFAIYLVKPSPFCILDEVDAPLDDANIDRFIRVLKEFARTTQFIMVTHNKLSMHAADTLHGVTMPEEGVSQLVSVSIGDEFLEEAAG